MTTLTAYPNQDRWLYKTSGTVTAGSDADGELAVGPGYGGTNAPAQSFVGFDTSTILSGSTVTAATLNLVPDSTKSGTFTVDVRQYDFGSGTVTTADWSDTPTSRGTAITTRSSSGFANNVNEAFTITTSLINKTGDTRFQLAPTSQTGTEYCAFYSSDTAGTSKDPNLVVTYTPASTDYSISKAITGTATVAPTMRFGATVASAVAGTSTVSPTAHMQAILAALAITAHGTAAAALLSGYLLGSAPITGASTIGTPSPFAVGMRAIAAVSGTSTVSPTPHMQGLAASAITGASTVSPVVHMQGLAVAVLAGASTLTANAIRRAFLVAAAVGAGTITAHARRAGTTTVYASNSGEIGITATSRANLDAGTFTSSSGVTTQLDGGPQWHRIKAFGTGGSWTAYQAVFDFDVSAIPAGAVYQSIDLNVYGKTGSDTGFSADVFSYDWGTAATSGDFRNKANLVAMGSIGNVATDSSPWTTGYNDISVDIAHIGSSGNLRLLLATHEYRTGATLQTFSTPECAVYNELMTGTSKDPYVVVSWVLAEAWTLAATGANGSSTITPTMRLGAKSIAAVHGVGTATPVQTHLDGKIISTLTAHGTLSPSAHMQAILAALGVMGAGAIGAAPHMQAYVASSVVGTSTPSAMARLGARVALALIANGIPSNVALHLGARLTTTPVVGASTLAGSIHMQARIISALLAHGASAASIHLDALASSGITGHAAITARLLHLFIAAHIAVHGSISANAIRKLYIQAVIDGASIIQTGSVFDEEGQRAAMRGHGWTVADGTPWYERLVRQGGV